MGIDLAVEQAGLPFRVTVTVYLSKWQVYRLEYVWNSLSLQSEVSSSLKFPVTWQICRPMLNDLAIHRAAPLPTPPVCFCSGYHLPVVLKPKRRGHDTANASIQTITIMRETLLQELCPVLYWY